MNDTKTRCKVCLSPRKEYIEEMIRDEVPLKIISERMLDIHSERISTDAVARHRNNHMVQPHSNDDRVQEVATEDEPHSDKTHSSKATEFVVEKELVEEPMSELEARVNALEIIMIEAASTASNTSFSSYDIDGKHPHSISYGDIANALHPNKTDIHGQYRALVADIKAKMVKDGNLVLSDESFIKPRAERNKKSKEEAEAGLAEAEAELLKREKQKSGFRNALEQLVAEEKRNAQ